MHFQVTRDSPDGLERQVWSFWYYDNRHAIVLDGYSCEQRESLRKKRYEIKTLYSRLRLRSATLQEEDVPMPADVVAEAVEKFTSTLRVAKWSALK